MKAVSGKAFARILESQGWALRRINGSHHIDAKQRNPARISIPIHGNKTLGVGLLRSFLKAADLPESILERRP